jgi:hypothetical protein
MAGVEREQLQPARSVSLPEMGRTKTELPLPAGGGAEKLEQCSEIYSRIGKEVLQERLEPAAWARALADCQGSRDEALTHYVRYRAEGLQKVEQRQVIRGSEVEQRKVDSFRDFQAEPIAHHSLAGETGATSVVDSLFWHVVAVVGMIGCLLAVGLLWPGLGFQLSWNVAVTVVLAMQLIPLAAWWYGRRSDQSLSYAQVARMAAVVAMVSSTGIGVLLLANPSDSVGLGLYRQEMIKQESLVRFPGKAEPIAEEESEGSVVER